MKKPLYFDTYAFVPPLTGIASVVKALEEELKERGYNVKYPKHVLPYRIENAFWSSKKFKSAYPLEKIIPGEARLYHAWWQFSPAPYAEKIPVIFTVHDLIPFLFAKEKRPKLKKYFQSSIQNSSRIMCVSENTKKDLLDNFEVDENKVKVVWPGIKKIFFKFPSQPLASRISKKIKNKNYFLTVGSILPHKNIQALIDCYDQANPLIIVGEQKEKLKLKNKNIIFTGYVKEEELIGLYDNALGFIFPSLYEGFGLPPLEAMARGCPVTSSNTASLPEILGNRAILFDPKNKKEISLSLKKIKNLSKDQRKEMVSRGREHVKNFTPAKFADRILKFYQDVAAE